MRVNRATDGILMVWCPGCDCAHGMNTRWSFDGNMERPTFSPSVLARTGGKVCHSFIRDGRIQFLADSTHALAGQTVELPAWPFAD